MVWDNSGARDEECEIWLLAATEEDNDSVGQQEWEVSHLSMFSVPSSKASAWVISYLRLLFYSFTLPWPADAAFLHIHKERVDHTGVSHTNCFCTVSLSLEPRGGITALSLRSSAAQEASEHPRQERGRARGQELMTTSKVHPQEGDNYLSHCCLQLSACNIAWFFSLPLI